MPTTKGLYTTNRTYVGMLRGTFATVAYVVPPVYTTDPLFSFNSLLLPGETDYLPFNADNSLNNFNVNVLGDAKASNFSPYTGGYYSAYFDGTGDYLTAPNNAAFNLSSGNWTIEGWFYFNALVTGATLFAIQPTSGSTYSVYLNGTSGQIDISQVGSSTITMAASGSIAVGSWYHIAFVKTSTSTITCYVNGVTKNNTTSYTFSNSNSSFYIGENPIYSGVMSNGYISNFRVVKGTAVYTTTFTPPTSSLVAISGTSLLTCQDNRFIDRSTNNFAITASGDAKISAANPFDVPASFASYGSFYSDGTDDILNIPYNSLFAFNGNFTVEYWVNFSAHANYGGMVSCMIVASVTGWQIIFNSTSNNILVEFTGGTITSSVVINPNQWNHVALSRNGSALVLYINGVSAGTATTSTTFDSGSAKLYIGAERNGSGSQMTGYISDVRITKGTAVYTGNFTPPNAPVSISGSPIQYTLTANVNTSFPSANTSLSLLQYSQPHNNSTFLDKSNFRQVITKNGNSRQGTFSPYGANWSAYFDGTTDYLTTSASASNLMTGDFTVELWAYQTTAAAASGLIGINNTTSSGGANFGLYLESDGKITFFIAGNGTTYTSSAVVLTIGTWKHIAFVRSGSTNTIYVDGVSVLTNSAATSWSGTPVITVGRLFGDNSGATFYGYLTNVRVVKGTAVYTAAFTPPTSPLTAISGTHFLTCQSNRFIDNSTNNFAITVTGDPSIQKSSPFGLTANASPTFTGGSGYFDGSGDSLKSAGSTAFTMGTGPFTVEYWVYQTVNTGSFTHHIGASESSNGFAFGTATLALYLTTTSVGYVSGTSLALNTWNHIAWTRDSSGNVRGYLNGVMVYGPTSITTNITETSFGIAETVGGGYNFTGYLSDIRVIKGMNVYTGNFTPPSAPLSLGGNSTIYSNTANVNTTFAGSNSTLMLNFTDAAIKDATTYFNLETVADAKLGFESAYSNVNYSNYFNGSADLLSLNYTGLQNYAGDVTIECWFKLNALPAGTLYTNSMYIIGGNPYNSNPGIDFAIGSNAIWFNQADYTQRTLSGTWTSDLNWHHVAVTRNTNTWTMWLDGVSIATATSSNAFANTTALAIGRDEPPGGDTSGYMNGHISNLRIVNGRALYTTAFTPSTSPLTAVSGTSLLTCQSNRFIDNSTNNFAITATGDPSVRSFNPFQRNPGSSLYFDGTGDYLRIANNQSLALGTGNFTIEFWANMTTNPSNQVILDGRPAGSHGAYPAILFESKYIRWYVSSATRIESTPALTLNTWYHVAICRVGGTTTMYINGNVSGSTWSDSTNYLIGSAGLVIGASTWSGGSANMNGYIDDLRITRGNARYTANFTPSITMFSVR